MADRFASLLPSDNVYLIKDAADLPDELDQWRIYHLLYDAGAGVGMYYSPDGVSLQRLATGAGAGVVAGTVQGQMLYWDTGSVQWLAVPAATMIVDIPNNTIDMSNVGSTLRMFESAVVTNIPVAGKGQFWVRNDVPNVPMFTDDAGTDFVLNLPVIADGTVAHNTLRWNGTAWVENSNITINPAGDIDIQADATTGFVNMDSPIIFGPYSGVTGAAYGFDYTATENITGTFVGGGLNFSGNITFAGGTFIYESFRGAPTINTNGNPGFAAYTVLQALPTLNSGPGAGHNPLPPLILNAGVQVRHAFAGTRTVSSVAAVNFASTLVGAVSGATLNCTNWIGMTVAPKWNTVAGSLINFGTIIGLDVQAPAQGLFSSSAGTERMQAFYGMQVGNPGINNGFGTAPVAAIRSTITLGTNRYFLLNAGTAPSDHGAAHMYFDDNFGTVYGGNGITNFDSWISWNAGSVNKHRLFLLANSTSLYTSNPNAARILFDINNGALGEFTFNCAKFSLGAQAGSNGNQVGNFVAGARSTLLAGEWSDFLLTQAGNITVDDAMGLVVGWTVNAPSIVLGTGTVTAAGALNIGGNVTQGSVDRFGVRILSNPVGGSGVNAALWVTAGRSQFDGFVDINKPVALGGGAAATLGTIGGAGPTAAAQAQWVEIEINGVRHWIPAWT